MTAALGGVLVEPGVGPIADGGLDKAFGFAVGARRVEARALRCDAEPAAVGGEATRAEARAVVCEHAAHGNAQARRKKEWGRVETSAPNQIWQSDMTKIWAGPAAGWAYLACVIDCCPREIGGWNLSHRCRTEDALAAVEQAVLERLPAGSRSASWTLTTDNGTQFTSSRFLETLARLGITHRRTAYHHPEGNSYIERFHRSLQEEEVWTCEDRNLEEAQAWIARWIQEYKHDRPDRGAGNRTPHEAFLAFAAVPKKRGPACLN